MVDSELVTGACDRCNREIIGTEDFIDGESVGTCGFVTTDSDFWQDFLSEGETVVCWGCIDPYRYRREMIRILSE